MANLPKKVLGIISFQNKSIDTYLEEMLETHGSWKVLEVERLDGDGGKSL